MFISLLIKNKVKYLSFPDIKLNAENIKFKTIPNY